MSVTTDLPRYVLIPGAHSRVSTNVLTKFLEIKDTNE